MIGMSFVTGTDTLPPCPPFSPVLLEIHRFAIPGINHGKLSDTDTDFNFFGSVRYVIANGVYNREQRKRVMMQGVFSLISGMAR